ncbi:IS110 family RNA-guided transposase [Kordiimonas aestuarii]|uniref:IS110 family transposase n=1 Tax=Kordiimonas aestuarii TaxID=1005925 RepID=UPI0021CFED57|nr:IS110 family transposase [Kordiimonas aestuarii]
MTYVGVDLHKRTFTVCYRQSEEEQATAEFENTKAGVSAFIATLSYLDSLAVEAMSMSRPFIKAVRPHVREVVHVNAARNELISKSNKKTDAHDARMLAFGLEYGILPRARFRSEAAQQLRNLVTTRFKLVMTRVSTMNFLHAVLARNGLSIPETKMRHEKWRSQIDTSVFGFGDDASWYILNLQMLQLDKAINVLEKKIQIAVEQFEGYKSLSPLPGFGPITIATLLSYIDSIDDFPSSKKLCSYFGIVPRTRMSAGEPLPSKKFGRFRTGAITRTGDTQARTAITMAANYAIAENESLRAFYDRIKGRKGYRKARTATARKLLGLVFYLLKYRCTVRNFRLINFSQAYEIQPYVCPKLPDLH